jgi:hypothetical protein
MLTYVGNKRLGFDHRQLLTIAETLLRSPVFAAA